MLGISDDRCSYELIQDVAGRLSLREWNTRISSRVAASARNRTEEVLRQARMFPGLVDRAWEEIEHES